MHNTVDLLHSGQASSDSSLIVSINLILVANTNYSHNVREFTSETRTQKHEYKFLLVPRPFQHFRCNEKLGRAWAWSRIYVFSHSVTMCARGFWGNSEFLSIFTPSNFPTKIPCTWGDSLACATLQPEGGFGSNYKESQTGTIGVPH